MPSRRHTQLLCTYIKAYRAASLHQQYAVHNPQKATKKPRTTMKGTKTLTIIKPKACENKYTGDIIKRIENEGFVIKKIAKLQLALPEAAIFYKEHIKKPFFQELCDYIASGPVVVMQLEKANAVADFRKLLGDSPSPTEATKGSLRAQYGIDINRNAVHGSDSDLAAAREIAFFFGENCGNHSCNCGSGCACG